MIWFQGEVSMETVRGIRNTLVTIHKGKGGYVAVVGTDAVATDTWEEAVNEVCSMMKDLDGVDGCQYGFGFF